MDGHSIYNDVVVDRFVFHGHHELDAVTIALAWPWIRAKTGTPGDIQAVDGALHLPLSADDEAQCNRLYMGVRPYRIADLIAVRFVVACSATLPAGSGIAFGMAHTPADDPDAINEGVWFRVLAGNSVVCESDDGTTDKDDAATGQSLGTTLRQFVINFRDGVWLGDPRDGGSVGGYKAILMDMHNAAGQLISVAAGTHFTLAAAGGPLQPFAQIFKSGGGVGPNLYVKEIEVEYRRRAYALSDSPATTTTAEPTTTTTAEPTTTTTAEPTTTTTAEPTTTTAEPTTTTAEPTTTTAEPTTTTAEPTTTTAEPTTTTAEPTTTTAEPTTTTTGGG